MYIRLGPGEPLIHNCERTNPQRRQGGREAKRARVPRTRTSGVHAHARKHGRAIKHHASRDRARNPNGTRVSCRPPRSSPTWRKPRVITASSRARWRRPAPASPPSAPWSTAPMAATYGHYTATAPPLRYRGLCRWREWHFGNAAVGAGAGAPGVGTGLSQGGDDASASGMG